MIAFRSIVLPLINNKLNQLFFCCTFTILFHAKSWLEPDLYKLYRSKSGNSSKIIATALVNKCFARKTWNFWRKLQIRSYIKENFCWSDFVIKISRVLDLLVNICKFSPKSRIRCKIIFERKNKFLWQTVKINNEKEKESPSCLLRRFLSGIPLSQV